jgi:uncharacterized protein YigE (DUF2233 family)
MWTSHNQIRKSIGDQKIFWQDNGGKMIQKFLNHLATLSCQTKSLMFAFFATI